MEAADDQLREIKKLRREEPKSFKRKGNEIQYKFNLKLQDNLDEVKSHLESTAVDKAKSSLSEGTSMLSERQKLILRAEEIISPPDIVNPLSVSVQPNGKKRLILYLRHINLHVYKQKFKCENLHTIKNTFAKTFFFSLLI